MSPQALGAPPDEQTRSRVLQRLIDNVASNDYHLTVGIMGVHWVLSTLVQAGRGDVALRVMLSDTFPSFGRWIQQNMTTLCESWLCTAHDSAGSANHPSFGSFDTYLHTALGGLRPVSNASVSGWRHFVAQPDWAAVLKLRSGALSHETRFGLASLSWSWQNNNTLMSTVRVPVGSSAEARHAVRLGDVCTMSSSSLQGSVRRVDVWGNEYTAESLGSGVHRLRATYSCRLGC